MVGTYHSYLFLQAQTNSSELRSSLWNNVEMLAQEKQVKETDREQKRGKYTQMPL